eukprot:3941967-Rhodomonas_salina.1
MRGEAKRISKTLHAVNVSLMKKPGSFLTASDVPMPNRTQQLQNLREDLQEMTKSVQSIAFSLGAPTPRPPRFDYIKANMATLENNRHHVIGARRIRQSIEFQDKIESAIVKNTQKQIEKCDDIAVKLRRRERRQHKNQMADLAYALERAQQTWIAASFLVRFTTVCSASLADFREYRSRSFAFVPSCALCYMRTDWAWRCSRWMHGMIIRLLIDANGDVHPAVLAAVLAEDGAEEGGGAGQDHAVGAEAHWQFPRQAQGKGHPQGQDVHHRDEGSE